MASPSLGPSVSPLRGRVSSGASSVASSAVGGGSVSGGPWQLVEVSNAAAGSFSQPSAPVTRQLWSPASQPAAAPNTVPPLGALKELKESDENENEVDGAWVVTDRASRKRWADQYMGDDSIAEDGFDPSCLVGDWRDNLGHRVLVMPAETKTNPRRRGGGGPGARKVFRAKLCKNGLPDKHFNISRDPNKHEWMCGNGTLIREESDAQKIVWQSSDGRKSSWERVPPDGPVYFDSAPPESVVLSATPEPPSQMEHGGTVYFDPPPTVSGVHMEQHAGTVYFSPPGETPWGPETTTGQNAPVFFIMPEDAGGLPQGTPILEWKALHLPADEGDEEHASHGGNGTNAGAGDHGQAASWLNPTATEFVPASLAKGPAAPAGGSSEKTWTPGASPALAPSAAPVSAPEQPLLRLADDSPDLRVSGTVLEWSVPEAWGTLCTYEKDAAITSPLFGVQGAPSMQLVFYPNGSKRTEPGHCTVALTRGPDCVGIKFEFTVFGRCSGPKVCLGRRYMGDYQTPFDSSEGNRCQKVKIHMKVLEVLG